MSGEAQHDQGYCLDYGGTISAESIGHVIGQKPVDPPAAIALRTLHDRHGRRLILASNTMRWPALQQGGIDSLFSIALLSPDQVMFVGDNLAYDVAAPITHGMRAAPPQPAAPGQPGPDPDGPPPARRPSPPRPRGPSR